MMKEANKLIVISAIFMLLCGCSNTENKKFIKFISPYSVGETVEKITEQAEAYNITIFAVIDHTRIAENAGLSLRPEMVILLGNSKRDTLTLKNNPIIALDIPLRVLIVEQPNGKTLVMYHNPLYLAQEYNIPAKLLKNKVMLLIKAALK